MTQFWRCASGLLLGSAQAKLHEPPRQSQGLRGGLNHVDPYIVYPFEVSSLPAHMHGFSKWFSKHVPVVASSGAYTKGVQVVATGSVDSEKVKRVANVLAEYLDNDEDGEIDNPEVAKHMLNHGATMIMFASEKDLDDSDFDDVPGFDVQDVEGDETSDNRTSSMALGRLTLGSRIWSAEEPDTHMRCAHKPKFICDATLEEVLHLVTDTGYQYAYPDMLGTQSNSSLSAAMEKTIADCGYASTQVPQRLENETFSFPQCSGTYHYDDDTCSYRCLTTEFFHHFVASLNGEYTWNKHHGGLCNDTQRAEEWELCLERGVNESRALLQQHSPDGFALITKEEYRVPLRMPDGTYEPSTGSVAGATVEEVAISGFVGIALESRERRNFRRKMREAAR